MLNWKKGTDPQSLEEKMKNKTEGFVVNFKRSKQFEDAIEAK